MRLPILLALAVLIASDPARSASPAPEAPPPAISPEDGTVLASALIQAPDQGFEPNPFDPGDAAARLASPDPVTKSAANQRLTALAIAYASAQHGGRLQGRFPHNWAVRPAPYDAKSDFAAALAGGRLAAWVRSLPPPDERYGRLIQANARYREIAAQGGWDSLTAAKPVLKPGATGERVEALRRRLAVEDPLTPTAEAILAPVPPPPAPKTPKPAAATVPSPSPVSVAPAPPPPPQPTYTEALASAVSRAQTRYGLTPDGVAGASTIAALNVPIAQRLAQMRADLERWRWMPRSLPAYRVELNIADASLTLFEPDGPNLTMRTIVGKPSKPTPTFQDRIRSVVLNPPWNVPNEIAAREVWPKIRRTPGYMAREGFVVRSGGGLQQRPGPKCALGMIKFDLSNSFGVYLHDTPSRRLFSRDSRTLSHGCMRLEKPNELAKRVLRDDPAWPATRIDLVLAGGSTTTIPLARPVPLYVTYFTVFVDDQGQVQFRPDVYGWDEKLLGLL